VYKSSYLLTYLHTNQFPSSPWASALSLLTVSALGSRVGWTPARNKEIQKEDLERIQIVEVTTEGHWHASLVVCSTIHRQQPPQRAVLSQIECFIQCEAVGSQISLDSVQPRDMGMT